MLDHGYKNISAGESSSQSLPLTYTIAKCASFRREHDHEQSPLCDGVGRVWFLERPRERHTGPTWDLRGWGETQLTAGPCHSLKTDILQYIWITFTHYLTTHSLFTVCNFVTFTTPLIPLNTLDWHMHVEHTCNCLCINIRVSFIYFHVETITYQGYHNTYTYSNAWHSTWMYVYISYQENKWN